MQNCAAAPAALVMTPCGPGSAAAAAAAMETAKEAWHRQGRLKHNKNQECLRPTQTCVTRHLLQMTAWSVCDGVCAGGPGGTCFLLVCTYTQ